jgi:hypothetical protein
VRNIITHSRNFILKLQCGIFAQGNA